MRHEKATEVILIRLTASEGEQLDEIMRQGGYSSRNEVVRSMVRSILVDERTTEPDGEQVMGAGR